MKHGEPPQHIIYWAPADWLTSRVRNRSAMTNDPLLRTVYFELLNVLYANDGEAPADPAALADLLLLPEADVARCLPILSSLGSITMDLNVVRQFRVTKEIARFKTLSNKRRTAALARWDTEDGPKKGRPTWLTPYADAWRARFAADPQWEQLAKEFKPLHDRLGETALVEGWCRYLGDTDPKYASPAAFARRVGAWVRQPKAIALPRPKLPPAVPKVQRRWRDACERIEIAPHLKHTWLLPSDARYLGDDGGLTIIVPSQQHADAVKRYAVKLLAAYNEGNDEPAQFIGTIAVIPPDDGLHDGGL